jgi:hypothetical protein
LRSKKRRGGGPSIGGLPRILSLAAERAKEWFWNPQKCPLLESDEGRRTRSGRREAIQVALEYLFSRLDLVALCVGTPTLNNGFVDLGMRSIVESTGLGQRRCGRAIGELKEAGFMTVAQPRYRNRAGKYVGLRAVRCLTAHLVEWLELGPMLARELARASQALKNRLAKYGRSLSDVVNRTLHGLSRPQPMPRQASSLLAKL